jgi:hypothetical protein
MVRLDQQGAAVKLTKDRPTRRFDRAPDVDLRHKLQKVVVEIKAWSKKFMGDVRFRQFAKCMIQGGF